MAARIRRLAITVDPDQAKKRYEQGVEERRVVSEANPDGTANLGGYQLPVIPANQAMSRIDQTAHQLKASGDPRSLDQIRADLFLELLNGGSLPREEAKPDKGQGRNRGVTHIRAELSTLLELDQNPGEIPGWGPVIADITRQIISEQSDAEWRYHITTPDGIPITGTTRKRPGKRRPNAAQKRQIQAETPECVWPTCRIGSVQCDLDHNLPWTENGPTEVENLAPLCRHHHVIKHNGWTITQIQPGIITITSPLGHTYTTQPRAP